MKLDVEDARTWRELLSIIISDPYEKQRILKTANINPVTLTRWIKNISKPRPDNLRPLLEALPQYSQRLAELIAKEIPLFLIENTIQEETLEVPSNFYARVLAVYTTGTPLLRQNAICTLIIQQMLDQLDPQPEDLGIILTLCVRPEPGQKVHSLYKTMGRASHYRGSDMESLGQFMGSESQTGSALMHRHPLIVQNRADHKRFFPHHIMGPVESVASFPILLIDQAAGVLSLACTQSGFFTQSHVDLIQRYINLLVLAFRPEDFYPLHMIELGMMPPRSLQSPYLANIQQRITQYMIARGHHTLTRPQAEVIVRREIETELLQLCC